MSVVSMVVGATSPSTATVVAKVDGLGPVRVAYQDDPALPSPAFTSSVAVDAQGVAKVLIEGLDDTTKYWYQVEDNSVLDTTVTGSFRTHPPIGQPADVTVAFGGCAGSTPAFPAPSAPSLLASDALSNSPVFGHIADAEPLMFCHMGDLHYGDIGEDHTASVTNYRAAYDDVLAQPEQHALYRSVAWQYVWDNHDYGRTGPNTSDGTLPGRADAQQVFRERVPHYPLTDSAGIWQQWRVGRVQFVALDSRSYRDPNLDPDTADKTMLGTAQRAWLEGLLQSTPAVFLVLISPSVWHNPALGADTWESFQSERSQLINLFTTTGFIDRMCVIWGDRHAMGMGTGTLIPGGMPGMQFTAMDDSTPPPAQTGWFDTGIESSENGQWGTVRLNDLGDTLELTATGYVMDAVWRVMSVTVDLTAEPEPEPEEPDGGLEQVSVAQIRTRLTWLSCNLSDGAVITELPDLQGDEVSRVIGEYTSANLSLPIPAVGGRNLSLAQRAQLAAQSTEPARTMIVPVVNDVPTAGFIPLTRDLGTEATVQLGCVSLEGYLRHRYVRDHLWEGVDPAEIARGVLADAEDIDGNGQGLGLIVDAPDVGLNAGRYFQATDDETVYGALSELMDAGLIEWTIDVDWRDGMAYRIVDKIARVRLRLGRSGTPTAVFQSATFSSQGASDARYTLKDEYSGDRYGNWIVARGTGEGEDQPRSSAEIDQTAIDSGTPIWEQRIQPDIYRSPLFTEEQFNEYVQEQLELHATQELARIRDGSQALEITARWDAPGARYGVDWQLGDDVLHELKGHAHPGGFNGVKRAIGFALSIQAGTIRPILQEEF